MSLLTSDAKEESKEDKHAAYVIDFNWDPISIAPKVRIHSFYGSPIERECELMLFTVYKSYDACKPKSCQTASSKTLHRRVSNSSPVVYLRLKAPRSSCRLPLAALGSWRFVPARGLA